MHILYYYGAQKKIGFIIQAEYFLLNEKINLNTNKNNFLHMSNKHQTKKNYKGFVGPMLIFVVIVLMLIVAAFTTNIILFQILLVLLILVMAAWMIIPLFLPGSFKGRVYNK